MAKGTKYSQQFKEDAVQYRLDHPEPVSYTHLDVYKRQV